MEIIETLITQVDRFYLSHLHPSPVPLFLQIDPHEIRSGSLQIYSILPPYFNLTGDAVDISAMGLWQ